MEHAARGDRRRFLRAAGGAAGAAILANSGLATTAAAARRVAANDRIGFGLIGCGDLGRNWHLASVLGIHDLEVVAVADVDRDHLEQAVAMTEGKAKGYGDFRALLDRKDVDAVMVVTPDHWHALAAIAACEAGKDVYCEKPLSYTVAEGRAMVAAARRFGRVVQTGSQQRSSHDFHWACDLVRNGHIGKVRRVVACLGGGPTSDPTPDEAVPARLDWNAWVGPRPLVPYNPQRCHYTFRWFYDYSGGKMTDWGAHHLDIAQWALGAELSGPVAVAGTAVHPARGGFETAVTFEVRYRYADGVELVATSEGENGVTFEGSEGQLFVSRERIAADPPEILDRELGSGAVRLYESRDHRRDWIECMRTRALPICDVEIGHRSATVCHLGNIAIRLGRALTWDPAAERFEGDDAANRLLRRPMRAPYAL